LRFGAFSIRYKLTISSDFQSTLNYSYVVVNHFVQTGGQSVAWSMVQVLAVYLQEELLDESFSPIVMQVPRFRRMTDVSAVHDQRQRLRLVNTASTHTSITHRRLYPLLYEEVCFIAWKFKTGSIAFRRYSNSYNNVTMWPHTFRASWDVTSCFWSAGSETTYL